MNKLNILYKLFWILVLAVYCHTALVAQTPALPALDTLPVLDSLSDETVFEYATRLSLQAVQIRDVFDAQAATATLERDTLEKQLAAAKEDTLATPELVKDLNRSLRNAKSLEKLALKEAKKAQKAADFAEKISAMEPGDQRKNLSKVHKTLMALIPEPVAPEEEPIAEVIGVVGIAAPTDLAAPPPDSVATEPETVPEPVAEKKKKEKKQATPQTAFKAYDPKADVMLNPPTSPCRLTVDTRDEFSGERRREMHAEELFRFTNPALKTYFQDREHVICDAAIAVNNSAYVLQLTFTINDVNAMRSFGGLPRNGVAILKYLDGETTTLYNLRADEGQADAGKQVFTFHGQYTIESGMMKKMQRTLLDKIRVAWATGYEDYDIQNVDVLVRQLDCLGRG